MKSRLVRALSDQDNTMNDKHPTYQKILYWACWIILAGIIIFAVINVLKG